MGHTHEIKTVLNLTSTRASYVFFTQHDLSHLGLSYINGLVARGFKRKVSAGPERSNFVREISLLRAQRLINLITEVKQR